MSGKLRMSVGARGKAFILSFFFFPFFLFLFLFCLVVVQIRFFTLRLLLRLCENTIPTPLYELANSTSLLPPY